MGGVFEPVPVQHAGEGSRISRQLQHCSDRVPGATVDRERSTCMRRRITSSCEQSKLLYHLLAIILTILASDPLPMSRSIVQRSIQLQSLAVERMVPLHKFVMLIILCG